MLPWSADLAGRLEQKTYESELLRGNPLGDPHERPVLVYLPPGYDESDQRYPTIYVTMGYTVDSWTKYGGSQCLDSPGTGQYHSYLCEEIVPWVD